MESNDMSIEAMALRLKRLELQHRRLKQTGMVALLMMGAVLWMGQAKVIRPVEATKFILRNAKGKKRAELGVQLDGPALVIYDDKEKPSLSVGILEDGPGLVFWNSDEKKIASFTNTLTGPVITLGDAMGNRRLNMSVTDQGPAIGLLGPKGEAKVALALVGNEFPFLQLFGGQERGGAQLISASDMTALRFLDSSDHPRAVFGMLEKEAAPGIALNDANGTTRGVLMLLPNGAALNFFDEKKQPTWHAP
jgi:hypothetical protein